jgi:hypothetical protein
VNEESWNLEMWRRFILTVCRCCNLLQS